jgi:hypothetical protein
MRRLFKKLRVVRKKLEEDNRKDLEYESGMMGLHAKDKEEVIKEDGTTIINNAQHLRIRCSHCKSNSHQCKTSKVCTQSLSLNSSKPCWKSGTLSSFSNLVILVNFMQIRTFWVILWTIFGGKRSTERDKIWFVLEWVIMVVILLRRTIQNINLNSFRKEQKSRISLSFQ